MLVILTLSLPKGKNPVFRLCRCLFDPLHLSRNRSSTLAL